MATAYFIQNIPFGAYILNLVLSADGDHTLHTQGASGTPDR